MKDYMLTIRVPIQAVDDVQARQEAANLLAEAGVRREPGVESKLQEVYPNKQPRKVRLETGS
jgi:hypothetical protein